MSQVLLSHAVAADAPDLIRANQESRDYHRPWVEPFTDADGFKAWLGRIITGPHVGLVAREIESREVIGVVNLSEIVAGTFQSAYLGYYGMARHTGRGLMTEALRLAIRVAFCELALHRLEARTFSRLMDDRLHSSSALASNGKDSRNATSSSTVLGVITSGGRCWRMSPIG